jgi:Phosphotransferase enzyme family
VIAGLDDLLAPTRQPGLRELRVSIGELLGGPRAEGRVVGEQRLDRSGSVNRLRFEVDGVLVSVVAKRSRPAPAQRNNFVVRRCLPAVGLDSAAPAILATAAEREGRCVWQIYEDLGDGTLETDRDLAAVRAAVHLLSEIHLRFIRHPLLAEVRDWGGEYGPGFYRSCVQDAIACLEALPQPHLDGVGEGLALRDRLLGRMWALQAQERERTEAIVGHGGPETLLHGDLWLKNVAVARGGERLPVGLIDWDHAGVGPLGYDLSTFVNGFSPGERDSVLDLYGEAVDAAGWQLPSREDLNYLFSTFELARLANCVIWPALAAADGVDGALEELAMADDWLGSLDAALPAS